MTQVKKADRPTTFAPFPVKYVDPTSGELKVIPAVVYKYRTRSEFAGFMDARNAAIEAAGATKQGSSFTVAEFWRSTDKATIDTLLDCIESWGLDVPVSAAVLGELADEKPAATQALWVAYGNAARDGRLGN